MRAALRIAAVAVCAWSTPAVAQQPRDGVTVPQIGTARISGIVIATTGERKPLRRARVTLTGEPLKTGRAVITADDGRFAFERLPAGRYSVTVAKSGYVGTSYGARRPGGSGTPVVLPAGVRRDITVPIARGAVITGTLSDADGQPVPNMSVVPLAYRYVGNDTRRLTPILGVRPATTDDRGDYRIFGLPAGEYFVMAQIPPAQQRPFRTLTSAEIRQALSDVRDTRTTARPGVPLPKTMPPPRPVEPPRTITYSPVFYPGTATAAHARPITLGPGEERGGVDFDTLYVPTARVTGTVVLDGNDLRSAYIRLVPASQDGPGGAGFRGTTTRDGSFGFEHVTPGRYTVVARVDLPQGSQDRYGGARALWALTEIAVDGDDVPNVVLTPQSGLTLRGRVVFAGERPAPPLPAITGRFVPLIPATLLGNEPQADVDSTGAVTIRNLLPGTYRPGITLGLRTPIGGWWLKSVTIDGREVLDGPLDIRASIDDMIVTLSDAASEVTGRVLDARGDPATGATVIVFGADTGAWFFNSRRIAAVRPNASGRYTIRNLPPGEYLAVADDDIETGEWFNPQLLQSLVPAAARIRLQSDETLTVDLAVRDR